MLESYYAEIERKKRAARIFWLMVFLFAGFLFFFFQGYYPDIRFSLSNISSGSISGEDSRVTIRSFGIINIKTIPATLDLRLNTTPYGNNEKKMVDYGDYFFTVSGEEYLPGKMEFSINNEKPYYIDTLTLVPKPKYTRFSTGFEQIARIGADAWIMSNASGTTLFEGGFGTGSFLTKKRFSHIGEGHFLSGNTIMTYDLSDHSWVTIKNTGWIRLIERCPDISINGGIFYCKKTQEAVLPNEKIFTGILSIGNGYMQTRNTLIPLEKNTVKKTISLSGIYINENTRFVSVNNEWFSTQSGNLVSLAGTGTKIITSLSLISYMEWLDGELLIFGKKDKDTFLVFYNPESSEKIHSIPFPDISLEAVRIWKMNGNIFIKTSNTLLLIYHGSSETHWIIDGDIITTGNNSALYKKDGVIWQAEWQK